MLTLFPIQFLAPLAYMLLRLCAGFILLRIGSQRLKQRVAPTTFSMTQTTTYPYVTLIYLGVLECILGTLFIVGLFTQLAALVVMLLASVYMLRPAHITGRFIPPRIFFFLLFFVAMSLFITGAGAFAVDLPI